MNLTITNLGIKNFRSFDDEGIFIDKISKINLLIGKNNSGKSNILKFLRILSELENVSRDYPENIYNYHNRIAIPAKIFCEYTFDDLDIPSNFSALRNHAYGVTYLEMTERFLANPLRFEYEISANNFYIVGQNDSSKIGFDEHNNKERLYVEIINKLKIDMNASPRSASSWQRIENHFKSRFLSQFQNLLKQIVYIPDFREIIKHNSNQKNQFTSFINGANIIDEMNKMKNFEVGEEESRRKFNHIEETIKKLLGVTNLEIDIPFNVDKLILNIDKKRFALENLGTGLHEIILLCSALIVHSNCIICVEEPEIHLHPELQRKFIDFLYTTNHKYFISTHSNVFLNHNSENSSIYHVKHDGEKSKISRTLNSSHLIDIINTLGYKASDLLQTNGIIWVEGPSDRIYLNKWISLLTTDLIEGINYTIMFYGGKLLSHVTYDYEYINSEFISLLKINKNAFVIIDRDGLSSDSEINATKQRIQNEIGIESCWITNGREVENYLSHDTLSNWLKLDSNTQNNFALNENTKLETLIENVNNQIKYKQYKVKYSKEISSFINKTDLSIMDLEKQISRIIDKIRSWNNLNN